MDYYTEVGNKIKELRDKRNMSRAQLAEGICSVSYISRIESGTRCPNSLILRQFSNKLGISGDILLRAIESPTALKTYKLINKARINMEYNRFEEVKEIMNSIDLEKVESIHDKQIILTLTCIADSITTTDTLESLKKIDEILYMTYTDGSLPTNAEFALLLAKANSYILINEFSKAEEILDFLEGCCIDIVFYVSIQPLIRFFMAKAILAYHQESYVDAQKYITTAILKAKTNCFHGSLIECYYLRSKIFEAQGNYEKAKYWDEHSVLLIELLLTKQNTPYLLNVDRYINIPSQKSI